MYKSDSILEITKALVAFHADPDLKPIKKTADGTKRGEKHDKYADLTAIFEAVRPLLARHKLIIMQTPANKNSVMASIETVILHESGEYISGLMEVPVARQNDAQAFGSAITYARRYSLLTMLGLVTDDDDGQSATVSLEDILRDLSRVKNADDMEAFENEHGRRYVSDKLWGSVVRVIQREVTKSFEAAA